MTTQSQLDFGPLQPFWDDKTVHQIMVNGPQEVYVARSRKLIREEIAFESHAALTDFLAQLVAACGGLIDADHPIADLRLEDGSRINIVLPPLALNGAILTIRKFTQSKIGLQQLVEWGTLNDDMIEFLKACIAARLNILVAGGVGAGKTTLINVLSEAIPKDERIITIEDFAEYRLPHPHVINLESRPNNLEGERGITLRDLVLNVTRMYPNRVLLGQLMGDEAFEVLRLIDRGYDGTIASIFASNPAEALERLEMLVKRSEPNLPVSYLRSLIASSINLILQQNRADDGTRKLVAITEVQPGPGSSYELRDIFVYRQDGWEGDRMSGHFEARPISDRLRQRLTAAHVKLPPAIMVERAENQD